MFPVVECLCLVSVERVVARIVSIYIPPRQTFRGSTCSSWAGRQSFPPPPSPAPPGTCHLAHLWFPTARPCFLICLLAFRSERGLLAASWGQFVSMALICAALFCLGPGGVAFARAHWTSPSAAGHPVRAPRFVHTRDMPVTTCGAHWGFPSVLTGRAGNRGNREVDPRPSAPRSVPVHSHSAAASLLLPPSLRDTQPHGGDIA